MFNSSLTIAVPLYNESETIDYMKERLIEAIEKINLPNLNILFVDDGSTDNTFDLLTEKFFDFKNVEIIRHNKNKNLNGFLITVINNCDTEFVVFLDSDCTFDPIYIADMLNLISPDIDIINGSPYHPEGDVEGVKRGRLLVSNGANMLYKLLVDKFNEKYSVLNESQKDLLNKYITHVNDTASMKEYFSTVIPTIKSQLSEQKSLITDKVTKIKVERLSEMLCNVETINNIKESHILTLLRYFDLIKELKEVNK